MKLSLITLILFSLSCLLNAQDIEKWVEPDPRVLFEKVYFQTDRELYSPGDTIWFKSYLVGGLSNKLIPGYKNIYLQLISSKGEVISNRLLLSEFGEARGDIALCDTLPEGKYILRARTKYLENFGEESYFHKKIWINKAKSSLELEIPEEEAPEEIEAMYFPEGGNLILNAPNHVAFKVISIDGRGIEASGIVINQNNDTITTFSTSFLGMGRFVMMPKEGEKYFAIIDNYPGSKQELGNILDDGFILNFKDEGNEVLISASRDFKQTGQKRVYLSASYKGLDLFHEQILVNGFTGAIRINKNRFQRGINKITLSDSYYSVLAERLVYIDIDYGNTVKVETAKGEYSTREQVTLNLEPILPENDTVTSTLSISVLSEDYLGAAGISQNIKSYLLVDSELKGVIESPAFYFIDEEGITAQEKLDLLMMVQGWRSYYWDDIIEKDPEGLTGWEDAGISISGHVKRLLRDRDVIGGKVTLTSVSPSLMLEETETDSLGDFKFDNLFLVDSSEIMLTALNEKGGKSVEVVTNIMDSIEAKVDSSVFNQMLGDIKIPLKYYRQIYLQKLAENRFIPEEGAILLDEVTVSGKITVEDRYELTKPLGSLPDNSYIITPNDYKYKFVRKFVIEKVGSPWVGKYYIRRDAEGGVLPRIFYVVDGRVKEAGELYVKDMQQSYENISIEDVYRIDLYKTLDFGAINKENYFVYTKAKSRSFQSNKLYKDIIVVRGFHQPIQFYSPKYTLDNINDEKPDYRSTLFWSPEVQINNGKGIAEFFTCDNLLNYLIVVEGVSKNGNICYGLGKFSVTNRNSTNN